MTLTAAVLAAAVPALAAEPLCLDYPYAAADSALAGDIAEVREALTPFADLLTSLDTARPRICLVSGPSEALGTFETEGNLITAGEALDGPKRQAVLIHEIRHLDQYLRGICPSETLAMRDNARAVFALEADAMAITHLVAWSSRERGEPAMFDALLVGDETADIATAFQAAITAGGDISVATAAAFDAWYGSEARLERYYISTCMAYLDRIEDEDLLPGKQALSSGFLSEVCALPGQESYPCEEPERPLPR